MNSLLIIDIECTCWEDKSGVHEVIQVGKCILDGKENIVSGEYVRPTTTKISPYCTNLTGIKESDVENARTFRQVCDDLREIKLPWASWGNFDRIIFERQCRDEGIEYPLYRTHLNLKHLFSLVYNTKEKGTNKALKYLGLDFIGTPHNAIDDTFNIARIAELMIKRMQNVQSLNS